MKKLTKKLCTVALAVSACMATPVMLVACGDISDGDDSKTCTVTFDAGWGTIYGDRFYEKTVAKNSTFVEPEKPVFDREDYMFMGWNVSGSERDPMWKFDSDKITEDITLRAVWVQAVTVTFDARGGKFSDGSETYTVTVPRNGKLTAPQVTTPPDADKQLQGWHDGYTYWDFSENIATKDFTLRAQWDLKDEIKAALEPFVFTKHNDGYWISGVKNKLDAVNVVIPDIVVGLEENAFADCKNLVSVTMHDNVVGIGTYAFKGCDKLKTVAMSANLTSIGGSAFESCTALESIEIPSSVTEIGTAAFRGCTSLTSIELPIGVTRVSNYTFSRCTALREVRMGDNVTQIGSNAFYNCVALDKIDIPANLAIILDYAFCGCTEIKSLTIPATCEEVKYDAFKDCTKLATVELHAKTIGGYAFDGCTSLSAVTIGDEVQKIDYGVFRNCKSITEIELPDSVTEVGMSAFIGCTGLRSAKLGKGITAISASAFSGCMALKNVEFGDVKTIGKKAFENCRSLLSFTVPQSVEKIESDAFDNCSRLVEIYNLSSVTVRGANVVHTDASEESIILKANGGFSFCRLMDNSVYPYVQRLYLLDYTGERENLVLPDDYNGESYYIYAYALAYNAQLTSVEFSAGVMSIGDEILLGCDNVTELTVDGANTQLSSAGNCVIITEENKFILGCKASVIPADGSVTKIGGNVFCHNLAIDSLSIPDCVTSVESGAFDGCERLMRTAENHIVYVDKWAYALDYDDSKNPLDLKLEEGTVGICDGAFRENSGYRANMIASFKCNAQLKYIGAKAFYDCAAMTEITLNDGLKYIGAYAFVSCDGLKQIVIPDSVEEIVGAAFMSCDGLEYAKLSEGLTVINYQLFSYCDSLKAVVIPSSVKRIERNMLSDCPQFTTVYYGGNRNEWALMYRAMSNDELNNATVYYYSETETENGWHYDADGKPTTEY